jgi:hypothetical protein
MTLSRPARAFFSTSLVLLALAGAAPAGAADLPPLAELRIAEYETALAKGKGIYLILDPARKTLTVKSRGLELSEVTFDEIALLEFRPLWSGGAKLKLPTPTVWKITEGPGDADRETIAPPSLRPYSEEEEAPAEPAATTTSSAPAKKKPDEVERPSTYRVGLDNGWQLYITPESPGGGFFRRLAASVQDGWLRLKGKEPKHPPLVALVMPAERAQSLHHLFRTGNEILVLP